MNPHKDLFTTKELIFDACELAFLNLKIETEGIEYGACTFTLNDFSTTFRVAKITPTKIGQFVTHWKRNQKGITEPFHVSDNIDFAIICTRRDADFGVFIFPKSVLQEKGILSDENKEGKRGFRVYPPWDITINKQAKQTQEWQLKYFLEVPINAKIDIEKTKYLFTK